MDLDRVNLTATDVWTVADGSVVFALSGTADVRNEGCCVFACWSSGERPKHVLQAKYNIQMLGTISDSILFDNCCLLMVRIRRRLL